VACAAFQQQLGDLNGIESRPLANLIARDEHLQPHAPRLPGVGPMSIPSKLSRVSSLTVWVVPMNGVVLPAERALASSLSWP